MSCKFLNKYKNKYKSAHGRVQKNMAEDNKRTQTELEQSLKAQLKLLTDYCNQYDAGNWEYVYPMSTALRVRTSI